MRYIPFNSFVSQVTPDQKSMGIWARLNDAQDLFTSTIERPLATIRFQASVAEPHKVMVEITPTALAYQKNLGGEFNKVVELNADRPTFQIQNLIVSLKPVQDAPMTAEFARHFEVKDKDGRLVSKQEIPVAVPFALHVKDEFAAINLGILG